MEISGLWKLAGYGNQQAMEINVLWKLAGFGNQRAMEIKQAMEISGLWKLVGYGNLAVLTLVLYSGLIKGNICVYRHAIW